MDRRDAGAAAARRRVPDEAIEAYEAVKNQVDLASTAEREGHPPRRQGPHRRVLRVGRSRTHPPGDDLARFTENVEQLQVRDRSRSAHRLVALLARFSSLAESRRRGDVARTHNVAAQATTLGKRFADVAEETMIGFDRVEEPLPATHPLKRSGRHSSRPTRSARSRSADELEQAVAEHPVSRVLDSVGQVIPLLDPDVVSGSRRPCRLRRVRPPRFASWSRVGDRGLPPGPGRLPAMPHKMNARSAERSTVSSS